MNGVFIFGPAGKLAIPTLSGCDLRLGRIDDLAVEHGGIRPHGDLAGLEQRHDVFPRHRRHALGTIVAQQLAVEADGVDRGLGIENSHALVEIKSAIVVDVARQLGHRGCAFAARGESRNAVRIELLGSGFEFGEVRGNLERRLSAKRSFR